MNDLVGFNSAQLPGSSTQVTLPSGNGDIPAPSRGLFIADQVWFETLYSRSVPDWLLEFRLLQDRPDSMRTPPLAVCFLQQPDAICAWLQEHRQWAAQLAQEVRNGADGPWPPALFWGLQPRLRQRGRKQDVAAFICFACDLDCKDWPELSESQRPKAIWDYLHTHAPVPSAITWTGHGFHGYWLLDAPLLDKARGEAIQRAMAAELRGDHVQDCSRLLRWPHTVNYKGLLHGSTPMVRVIWWQPDVRYHWQDLEASFPVIEAGRPAPGGAAQSGSRLLWKRFHAAMDRDSDLKALWSGAPTGLATHDRSALDMALAHSLTRHGYSCLVFETVAPWAPWNKEKTLVPSYLTRTWEAAQHHRVPPTRAAPSGEVSLGGKGRNEMPTARLAAVPQPVPLPQSQDDLRLPGLLLPTLPGTAWTEWANLYLRAVGGSTEAADDFHYISLLTVLGTALGRNVMVFCGRPLYVNMYSMLIGPTTDRKSTAAERALDLLRQIAPEVQVLNGIGSQEGLMQRMAEADAAASHRTLLHADEMASLLKKARRESSGSVLEFITELFHTPDAKTHPTRSKAIHLKQPTLNILACSTSTWLETALEQEDILGGFTNRFVYVLGAPKDFNPLPARPEQADMEKLIRWIRRILQAPARELGWEPAARDQWCGFYLEWRRSLREFNEHTSALLGRIDIYILKFASLAAAMDDCTQIAPHHLAPAIELGRFLAGCAYRILGELGAPRDCRLEQLIEQKLKAAQGQMRRKQLRQALGGRITGEKLDRILSAMERNGLVQQLEGDAHGARVVRLT